MEQIVIENTPQLMVSEVGFDLRNPCSDCPFTKSAPFHEGVAESLVSYLESIEKRQFGHTCHKTDCRDCVDGPRTFKGQTQHCVGAILMLFRTSQRSAKRRGIWFQASIAIAMQQGKITDERFSELVKQAKSNNNVFTIDELCRFYLKHIARLARRQAGKERLQVQERNPLR